ncbi:MAG: glycerate kinase [Clostridia bacterium]|nr:glycerate kinase [Clostridia bacterium]
MKKPEKKRKKVKKKIKIVIAPDSFKGSISAADAAEAVAEGLGSVLGDRVLTVMKPVADGGEGTLDALVPAGGRISLEVTGPDGDRVRAEYGIAGGTAVIEMARASGLTLSSVRRAATATTFGTGELIADALDRGIRHIMLTAGGSATNDGGCGMFAALGAVFRDAAGEVFIPTGGTLSRIASIDLSGLRSGFGETEFVIAADIKNPLLGPEGATYVYGRQKGTTDTELDMMERGMASYAAIVEKACGWPVSEVPGSGAAGGIGIPLIAFAGAEVSRGIDTVLKTARFDEALKGADAVITGEGKLDLQSLFGKAVSGVAAAAAKAKVPVDVICGCLGAEREELRSLGLREILALSEFAPDARSSMEDAGRWLKEAASEYAKKLYL